MDWLTPADPDELAAALSGRPADAPPLLPTGARDPATVEDAPDVAAAGDRDAPDVDVVSTARLAGLEDLRPRDLTVAAGAGTRVADLLESLTAEGVWVPVGGPALGMSLGGLAAAAPAGPFDGSYGDVKRQLLACGLATWGGERLRWGRAVMKDVAGYSMVRSVAGSFGRTGVVHRATFRLWPAPEALATPSVGGGGGGPAALEAAGALATSDADATVRPDAAVWSWLPAGPDGGRLEVRFVGSEASVVLGLDRLRSWAAERDAEISGDEPAAFDPLAAGGNPAPFDPRGTGASEGADGGETEAAAGAPGGDARIRDPDVSVLALRTGRGGFVDAARALRRLLGERARGLEGYPLAGLLRCAYRRNPGEDAADAFAAALDAAGGAVPSGDDVAVRVERGSGAELEAAHARRSEGARRLEARVLEELDGRPRHWLSAYL